MLEKLDDGLTIEIRRVCTDGTYNAWFDTEDRLTKAQVAVQVTVTFHGGIYRDTDFGPLRHVEVVGVEKKHGKETTDGE